MANWDRGPDDPHDEGTFDLRDVLATVRRRKWIVAAVTLGVIGLAALYSFTRVSVYTSEARVLVRPTLTSPFQGNPLQQLSLQTEMQLVTSASVANVAKRQMGSSLDVQELLRHVSVTAPENTQILDISYSDPDPVTAKKGAQAFAEAYLEFKRRQAVGSITEYTTTLQLQIQSLDQQITTLNERIARLPQGTPAWSDTLNRRDALTASRLALQTQFATLSTLSVDPGEIIQPSNLPGSPSSPKHELDLALGVLLGLLCGVGFASVHERVHDRILGRQELEQCLDSPVLGIIPKVPGLRSMSARLVTIERPRGGPAESYRTLRTNFLAVNGRPPMKTVLVTSAQTGEGKTTTAANLATTLALLGKRVTLISADLRYPRVHKFFDVPNDVGLSQVLSGDIELAKALRSTQIPHLQVLPSGPVTSVMEPVELLQSDRMGDVLAQCGGAEFVLIDGPPVLAVADSLALAEMVDGVLVVVNARKGKRALVIQARYQLRQVGGHLIGGVLNGFDSSRMGLGYYAPNDYRRGFRQRLRIRGSERLASKEPTTIAGILPAEYARGGRPKGESAPRRGSSRSRASAPPEPPGPAQAEAGEASVPRPPQPAQAEAGEASVPRPPEPDGRAP
jgi:tyrosine-protein kinase